MKRIVSLIPIVILLCFTFGCESKDDDFDEGKMVAALSDEDIAAIKAIGPAIDKATLAMDIDAIVELYTENTLLMNQNEPIIQGRVGVAKYYKAFKNVTMKEHKHELLEVNGYGDIAYARGAYKVAYVLENVAEPIIDEGKTLLILRKQPESSWLISIFCWNSNLPLPD